MLTRGWVNKVTFMFLHDHMTMTAIIKSQYLIGYLFMCLCEFGLHVLQNPYKLDYLFILNSIITEIEIHATITEIE